MENLQINVPYDKLFFYCLEALGLVSLLKETIERELLRDVLLLLLFLLKWVIAMLWLNW